MQEEKACAKCGVIKQFSEFYKKCNSLQSRCKDCFNEYTKQHYSDNKCYYKQKAIKSNLKHKSKIKEILTLAKSVPCVDCQKIYPPYVMDFDHVTGNKIANVSEMNKFTVEAILMEIKKCEVVCSNCHRERTHKRRMSL